MSASEFLHTSTGTDAQEAFAKAVEDASYDLGHAGCTGSIAEKDSFVMIPFSPGGELPTEEEASKEADRMIQEDDGRIDDKWGPAGCIEVQPSEKDLQTFGIAKCQDCHLPHQVRKEKDGWRFVVTKFGVLHDCKGVGRLAPKGTRASRVKKPQRNFLFFGWASS